MTTEARGGLPPRPKPNGKAGGPLGTPNEPVGLGSKPEPKPRAAAPAEPGRRLVGKELTDAVAGILAAGSEREQEEDDGQGDSGGEQGAGRGEPVAGSHGDEGQGEGEGGDGQEQIGEQDTTLEDVAKALRLKPAELNRMEITVDGQRVRLGDLKAGWARVAKLDQERAEFDERVTATELEQIDAHRRIMAVLDEFPERSLPPAVLQRVNQRYEQTRHEEAALLTKARPAWGDAKYVESERGAMLDLAKRYGFSAAEIGSILDHRQILLLQDFAHATARIDAAKGAARKVDLAGDKPLVQEVGRAAAINGRTAEPGASKKSVLARRVAELIAKGS